MLLAATLLAGLQSLVDDQQLAVAEPRRLRYALLHIAAKITDHARRITLALDRTWPWTHLLVAVHRRLDAMPATIVG